MSDALSIALTIVGVVVFIAFIVGGVILQDRMQRREIEQGWAPIIEQAGLSLEWGHEAGGVKAVAAGQYRGRPIKLQTFRQGPNNNQHRYTAITIAVQNPSGEALALRPRRWLDSLGGAKDVQVGDPAFDEQYEIKASPEGFAADVLDSEIRATLMQIPDVELKLEPERLLYVFTGLDTNSQRLLALLDVMSRMADAVEEAAGVEVNEESRVLAAGGEGSQEHRFASDAAPQARLEPQPMPPGAVPAANPTTSPRAGSSVASIVIALALAAVGLVMALVFLLSGGK